MQGFREFLDEGEKFIHVKAHERDGHDVASYDRCYPHQGDCTLHTAEVVTGIPKKEVWRDLMRRGKTSWVSDYGRTRNAAKSGGRSGVHTTIILQYIKSHGYDAKSRNDLVWTRRHNKKMGYEMNDFRTVNELTKKLKELNDGKTYFVLTTSHAMVWKDGKLHDQAGIGKRTRVIEVYEIEKTGASNV